LFFSPLPAQERGGGLRFKSSETKGASAIGRWVLVRCCSSAPKRRGPVYGDVCAFSRGTSPGARLRRVFSRVHPGFERGSWKEKKRAFLAGTGADRWNLGTWWCVKGGGGAKKNKASFYSGEILRHYEQATPPHGQAPRINRGGAQSDQNPGVDWRALPPPAVLGSKQGAAPGKTGGKQGGQILGFKQKAGVWPWKKPAIGAGAPKKICRLAHARGVNLRGGGYLAERSRWGATWLNNLMPSAWGGPGRSFLGGRKKPGPVSAKTGKIAKG